MATDGDRADWQRLIDSLNGWASAVAEGPDRIRVALADADGARRDVLVHLSPDDWSDMYVVHGAFEDCAEAVRRALLAGPADHGHLVYDTYELHPSVTATLPEDPEEARLREHLRQNPGFRGSWVAVGKDGKAYPFPEVPPR